MDGYKEAQKEFPDIKLIDIIETGWDTTKAYAVVENAYTAHPETTAMMGTDFFSEQLGAFINRNNLKDKVKGALFDPTPGIIKYLKSGDAQVVLGQNPYLQGFFAVMQGYLYLVQKQPGLEIDTGYELITPENMQYYLDYYNIK
jgi:simple sugar transport system substrate-binding protein